jgi:hypothetical protein
LLVDGGVTFAGMGEGVWFCVPVYQLCLGFLHNVKVTFTIILIVHIMYFDI